MRLNEIIKESELNWVTPRSVNIDNYTLLLCNVNDVFNNSAHGFGLDVTDPSGGVNAIKDRLPRAKEHFSKGLPMDYPEVGYNKHSGTVDFTDGRHRTVAAYQMGYEYVPMLVSVDGIDEFRKIVRTK